MTGLAEAVWLALTPHPVLALRHRSATTEPHDTAVLFCPPFGWEEMCSYRGRREWAHRLAEAGYPCARIMLPGTGDSGGFPRDGDLLPTWIDAVSAAASWLRSATGSRRLVAAGIGLGGTAACLAAQQGAPIDDFVLWGVRASGRALLRELRAQAAMIAAHYPEDAREENGADGGLELAGFFLSAGTARSIEAAGTIVPDALPGGRRRVLLLGRDRLAPDRRLQEQFEEHGAEVALGDGAGFGALMSHPQESLTPTQAIGETLAWLAAEPDAPASGPSAFRPVSVADRALVTSRSGGPPVVETALRFSGELAGTFAVVTEPVETEAAPLCAVWLNGGALHHIGPNRAWVEIGRRWAARGVTTVRVDLPGIGESDGGEPRPILTDSLYYDARQQATRAVLEQLAARGIGDRFIVGGLCSGAYWALHAALTDDRVAGAMLLNLWAFFWTEALVAERATEKSLRALRGRGWRKLVRGQLTAAQLREGLASLNPTRLRAGGGYPVQRAQTPQIEAALDQLRDRRTETLLLLCQGEQLYDQLVRESLLDRSERWPNLRVVQLPTRDHMFRAAWLQRHVHNLLDEGLDRVLDTSRELARRAP